MSSDLVQAWLDLSTKNLWRAGSGNGHHIRIKIISWRLGGRHTQRPALKPFISARVSFATNRGCSISTLQKNLRETADNSFHFISCTVFEFGWIWFKYDKIFQKKHVKSRKWRWTSKGKKTISWRLGSRHTQRPALKPFISAHFSFATTEAVQSRRDRKTCVRPTSLSIFIGCTAFWIWFGSSMTRSFKRNMWRAGSGDGHHMEKWKIHGGSAAATHNDQL